MLCLVAGMIERPPALPTATRQLLIVTTASWKSAVGDLQRYERMGKEWRAISKPISVSVGKNGLAWGRGIHADDGRAPAKREGDGCAPAGMFRLGDAFGYAARPPAGCKLVYHPITERDYFVDAPAADDYNRWITIPAGEANRPEKLWPSFERMKRSDHLYEFGVVIHQNEQPIIKGKGSAIFLHVWRHRGVPTVGCTAMARDDLMALLRWLDPRQKPLLVQAPAGELKNILSIETTR
jgi:L,D-peptidoglycan transpeptidase YkuD (ErfK/YbiS/YcfS/YnhG family)